MVKIVSMSKFHIPDVVRLASFYLGDTTPSYEWVKRLTDRTYCLTSACDGDKLIGFSVATANSKGVVLQQLLVVEAWRRRGVGSKLLASFISLAKGRNYGVALIDEYNVPAQCFLRANKIPCIDTHEGVMIFKYENKNTSN